ncbi:ATP-dependent helicase, partial [Staphylococcus shinii]
KTTVNEIHDLNAQLFSTMYDIIQASEIQDDEVHKLHFVYHFDVTPILNDLHAIIHKLNMTLEFFNGMSHKSIKSVRKQFLYINDRFKEIEHSLKNNHTSYLSIKNLNQKSTIKLNVKDYGVKEILTKQVLDKFNSLTFISGTLTFNHTFDNFKHWFNKDIDFNTYEIDSTVMSPNQTTV